MLGEKNLLIEAAEFYNDCCNLRPRLSFRECFDFLSKRVFDCSKVIVFSFDSLSCFCGDDVSFNSYFTGLLKGGLDCSKTYPVLL